MSHVSQWLLFVSNFIMLDEPAGNCRTDHTNSQTNNHQTNIKTINKTTFSGICNRN